MKNFNYSFLSKLFHRFTLNSNQRLKLLFEIEKKCFLNKINNLDVSCLFITGLPRTGSTFLLNNFYKTNCFSSLQYSDMPLVTSPNLWSKINFFKKKIFSKERAHNDGILVNYESPEAFEEVFWRTNLDTQYHDKLIFNEEKYTDKVSEDFKKYIKIVCLKNNRNFYLSKNNNNIIRIKFLLENIKKKKILILFRNPLDQCLSMLEQHKNFLNLYNNEKFVLEYMNMLSHHEFGINHKPLLLNKFDSNYIFSDINYWLEYWVMIYKSLFQFVENKDVLFLSFETMTSCPDKIINKVLINLSLNINSNTSINEIRDIKKKNFDYSKINKNVLSKAINLYKEIITKEIKVEN